jgi:hypothetical protein
VSTLKVNNVEDLGADPVAVNGVLVKSAFPAGTILQVVQAVKTNTFTRSATTYDDVTDLSVSITPSSTNSKILVSAYFELNVSTDNAAVARLMRNSTAIFVGNADGTRSVATAGGRSGVAPQVGYSPQFLDSPNTTSAITYKIQVAAPGGGVVVIGRSGADDNNANHARVPSSITLMEVAG